MLEPRSRGFSVFRLQPYHICGSCRTNRSPAWAAPGRAIQINAFCGPCPVHRYGAAAMAETSGAASPRASAPPLPPPVLCGVVGLPLVRVMSGVPHGGPIMSRQALATVAVLALVLLGGAAAFAEEPKAK